MLIDLEKSKVDQVCTDICIVGAGAAGLTLARSLIRADRKVCVLEAGGLDFENDSQAFYEGYNSGAPYYDLADTRLRLFGGTTNIWGGRCVPLEPIDYEHREWVPNSGWPISENSLKRFVHRAHDALGLGKFDYDQSLWPTSAPKWIPEGFTSRFWRFDTTAERFQKTNCQDLIKSPDCQILIHANVQSLRQGTNTDRINQIIARSLGGKTTNISANVFVIACGGIENARLLLASNLGNHHDQVGRYFMEHPHGRLGFLRTSNLFETWSMFRKKFDATDNIPIAPVLMSTPEMQRENGILNSAITFKLQPDPGKGPSLHRRLYRSMKHHLNPSSSGRKIWRGYRATSDWAQLHLAPFIQRARAEAGLLRLSVIIRGEQAPNPNSRVGLARKRDAFGSPLADLNWQLSEIDKRTVVVMADRLDESLRASGNGAIEKAQWLDDNAVHWPIDHTVGNHPIGGYHHMGTTRMSVSPRNGVVDTDCRVHGYRNLFIAGSSVFPTSGWANPTLTLLALTYRLADHLNRPTERLKI